MPSRSHPNRRWAILIPVVGALVPLAAMLWAGRPWQDPSSLGDLGILALFVGFGLLPYAIAAVVLIAARSLDWLWWSILGYAVIIGVAGAILDLLIVTDDSSTAAIGFVFVPLYQLGCLPIALVVGAVAGLLISRRRRPHDDRSVAAPRR